MALDPDIAAMLSQAAASGGPSYREGGVAYARAAFAQSVRDARPTGWTPPGVHAVTDQAIVGMGSAIPLRIYRPNADPALPVIIYFHGGGWTLGDLDTHDAQARLLCVACEAVVVSVDYRLAPEHPYPAAFDDGVTVLQWVSATASLQTSSKRIAVAGDSSGGNLAAAVALWARDQGGPRLAAQCLIYPVVDLDEVGESWEEFALGFNLDAEDMRWFNTNYAPDAAQRAEPHASPLRAADFSGLPPTIVATASHDILRDAAELYASRLRDAGVEVIARRYEGMVHSFFRFGDWSAGARTANDNICAELKTLLHR